MFLVVAFVSFFTVSVVFGFSVSTGDGVFEISTGIYADLEV
ncbi:MAG: hypothetical protein ACLR43_11755 [Faecalibacillus faecis]